MARGRITVPADAMPAEEMKAIIEKWGADALRDSDGTDLPKTDEKLADKIYGKYFVVRGDNEWAKANRDELQHTYLMSDFTTATEDTLKIDLMKSYFKGQFEVDYESNPKKYWEVIDRTTGEVVDNWSIDNDGLVVIENAKCMHEYTVSFIWFARSF